MMSARAERSNTPLSTRRAGRLRLGACVGCEGWEPTPQIHSTGWGPGMPGGFTQSMVSLSLGGLISVERKSTPVKMN